MQTFSWRCFKGQTLTHDGRLEAHGLADAVDAAKLTMWRLGCERIEIIWRGKTLVTLGEPKKL